MRSPALLLILVLLAGCLSWTEDSHGNLKSFGVPGIPVWTDKSSPSSAIASNGAGGSAAGPSDLVAAELVADGNENRLWLTELNKWRETNGLSTVGENARLSQGSEQHARYLVQEGPSDDASFYSYAAMLGAAGHAEDSGKRSFTAEGAEAAGGGKRTMGVLQAADVSFSESELADITGWLVAPFHRFSILAPWVQVAGYGAFGSAPRRAAALALRGRYDRSLTQPVMFPPNGSTFESGAMADHEWPDPLSGCADYQLPVGLPISIQTASSVQLKTYSITDTATGLVVESCAIDAFSYTNSDAVTQRRGRDVLKFNGAVIIIPKHPLKPGGRYAVAVETVNHDFKWDFAIAAGSHKAVSSEAASTPRRKRRAASPFPAPTPSASRVW